MESKPKKRRVRKAISETPAHRKSQAPVNPDGLIKANGDAVETLFSSPVWLDIVQPLILESIAGVSGRFTNGRFYKGSLTKPGGTLTLEALSGYQLALEDLHNNLQAFVDARDDLKAKKKLEAEESKAPLYNPYMEELDETQD